MENENSNEEPLINEQPMNKVFKDKRSYGLKQLDNRKLYPIQERIGIYIIAFLSIAGLMLIGYTGVMALALNATNNGTDVPVVDAEDVYDMLDNLELEEGTEDVILESDDFVPTHEYVDPDEETEDKSELEEDGETQDEDGVAAPTTATITMEMAALRRIESSNAGEIIGVLSEGDIVDIIDLDYNAYWAHVSYIHPDYGWVDGLVSREFINPN